jgi:hypothetical protein
VVQKDALEDFLGWLLAVVGDLLKGFIGRSEDSVVCLGAIEDLD